MPAGSPGGPWGGIGDAQSRSEHDVEISPRSPSQTASAREAYRMATNSLISASFQQSRQRAVSSFVVAGRAAHPASTPAGAGSNAQVPVNPRLGRFTLLHFRPTAATTFSAVAL